MIADFTSRYPIQVYLEPGEAVALNAGILAATVLDIVHNDMPIAILDVSVPCHMPDILEMPLSAGGGRRRKTGRESPYIPAGGSLLSSR